MDFANKWETVDDNRLQEGKRGSFLLPRRPLLEEAVIRQGLVVFDMKIIVFLLPRLTNVLSSPTMRLSLNTCLLSFSLFYV
jgi:hypothetical protein